MITSTKHTPGVRAALAAALGLAAAGAVGPALAHHSFSAEFGDERATLEGEVSRVWWRNPHVRVEVAVEDEGGETVTWELQTAAVTSLVAADWRQDSLVVGDHVTVEGTLARNGDPKLYIATLTKDDGTVLSQRRRADAPSYEPSEPFTAATDERPIDITGTWNNSFNFRLTVDDLEPKPYPFTEEAQAIFDAKQFGDDPALRCVPVGMPRLFGAPRGMQVFDAGDFYLMIHEAGSEIRRVYMDGRAIPDDEPLSFNGFSVGRWEGEELVIETARLLPGWLDGSGLPMSGEATRLEERWTFNADKTEIARIMTIHDPFYTEPLTRVRGSQRADIPIREESCDPDSFFQDLYRQEVIESYYERDRL